MKSIDPDQLWVPWRCSRTEYPNMEEGGPLNSRLWSWSRLYPAAGRTRTRTWTSTRIRTRLQQWHTEWLISENKLQETRGTTINNNQLLMLTHAVCPEHWARKGISPKCGTIALTHLVFCCYGTFYLSLSCSLFSQLTLWCSSVDIIIISDACRVANGNCY